MKATEFTLQSLEYLKELVLNILASRGYLGFVCLSLSLFIEYNL